MSDPRLQSAPLKLIYIPSRQPPPSEQNLHNHVLQNLLSTCSHAEHRTSFSSLRALASRAHLESCLLARYLLWRETRAVRRAFCSPVFFLLVWSDAFATHDLHPFEVWSIGKALCIFFLSFFFFLLEKQSRIHRSGESIERQRNDSECPPWPFGHNTAYTFPLMNSHEAR